MDKKELRKIIKDRKRQYSSRQLEELSLSVLSRLDSNPHLQNAQTILMYYSLPDEVDTHHYIDQLVSRGKRVILPVVLDDTNMELREYSGAQDLKEGAYHINRNLFRLPENQRGRTPSCYPNRYMHG